MDEHQLGTFDNIASTHFDALMTRPTIKLDGKEL
jgi:hypothetical protein